MEKINLNTPDLVQKNIEAIAAAFPNAITEVFDEKGRAQRAVDFEVLKQELSSVLVEGDKERYQMTWPGKRQAILLANTPINKTLRPVRDDSVDWDKTQNLYIEGDNLDVLKLLQESYLNKVKCIYVDPPYNTGKDFIYKDDYRQGTAEYLQDSGQVDEEGNRLFQNNEFNGRFHSDWLNMIYPRLRVARDLLTDEGVIFISIGQKENHNLIKCCDEIYGECNRVGIISRMMKSGGNKGQYFSPNIEYILVYAKNLLHLEYFRESISEDNASASYSNIETTSEHAGEKYAIKGLCQPGLGIRPNQRYWIECPDGSFIIPRGVSFPSQIRDGDKILPTDEDTCWKWIYERYKQEKEKGNIIFKPSSTATALVDENGNTAKWNVFNKIWLSDRIEQGRVPVDIITKWENRISSQELKDMGIPFDFAKPTELIKYLISIVEYTSDDIILDFFSGSATTAHAVMQLNAEDSSNRKYIMVQLHEVTSEDSEAYKAGYKSICEIGKERIRRAAKKIKAETSADIDYGFRVFRIDSSNMKDVYHSPQDLHQDMFSELESNIKADRTGEDLLIQVMLAFGLPLSLPMQSKEIDGQPVYFVAENSLVACFAEKITEELVRVIAQDKPLRVVFRDSSFASDAARINVEEIFKALSPATEIKVL